MQTGKLIVVGAGIAGVTAAQVARAEYPHIEINLFSKEPLPFYNKIALNSFITGKRNLAEMHFYPPNWLARQRIDARWGEWIVSINPKEHVVVTNRAEKFSYDKLILATGATPSIPPIPGASVSRCATLWTMEDAIKVRDALPSCKNVAIIGGGVLGVETALDLAGTGSDVTLLEAQSSLLPANLNATAAEMLGEFVQSKRVKLRLNAVGYKIERGKNGDQFLRGNNETIPADLVLMIAGVKPNTKLADDAEIPVDEGILVNDQMATSTLDILACGNCTKLRGATQFLWNSAINQATIAGQNAFDVKQTISTHVASIHLKTPQMPLFICGNHLPQNNRDIFAQSRTGNAYKSIRLDSDGHIQSAILLGDTDGFYQIEHAINFKSKFDMTTTGQNPDRIINALKANTKQTNNAWVCQMCGYTHEGVLPPNICSVCAVGRDQFLAT